MKKVLETYKCHGVEFVTKQENERIGTCPFCGKDKHFYANITSGQFSCKHCGEEGNTFSFLKKYSKMIYEETSTEEYKHLAKLRSLPVKALRDWKLGWDGTCWLLPALSEKKTCRDIRRWDPKTKIMRSTAGCKVQLYGWYKAASLAPGRTIFICEGEWDAIAMSWLLARAGASEMRAVGVPGAGTFKDSWAEDLAKYKVVLCYDNDPAGEQGALKAYGRLKGDVRGIKILKWPSPYDKGYDVRDFIRDRYKEGCSSASIMKNLKKFMVDPEELPMFVSDEERIEELQEEILDRPPAFSETLEIFERWANMKPDLVNALKIMYATVLSTKVSGDPLWMYIVGPAGSGKTMLLISLDNNDRCIFRSSITAHTLVSGFRRAPDPSLLPKLNGKCCIWKDFTEVLDRKDKDEIYSTLRGAYDGQVSKSYGNDVERSYKNLHFSMLAGVTPAVHGDRKAMLGERFLKFEIFQDIEADTTEQIFSAMADIGKEEKMVAELQKASRRFLSRKVEAPTLPGWVKKRIVALSQLTSVLRAIVERKEYGEPSVLYMPVPEVGTRLAKQLAKLAMFLALIEGHDEVQYKEYKLVEKTAFDTSRKMYLKILQTISACGGEATVQQIVERTRLKYVTVSRQIDDLYLLKVVEHKRRIHGKKGRPSKIWEINVRIKKLIERAKIGTRPVKVRCRR